MRGQHGDWEVSLDENVGFQVDGVGLYARQRRGSGSYAWLTGWDEHGYPVIETAQEGSTEAYLARPPLIIPRDAILAIAEAVKPGPATGEVARLEAALRVEQGRTDRTLAVLLPLSGRDTSKTPT